MVLKFKETDLVENKDLRSEHLDRIEVLNKVKKIVTLDNTDILTSQLLANYYEVSEDVIRQVFVRNKEELISNGAKTISGDELRDIKSLSGLKSRAGSITVFSTRATLNVGMLLRDSHIALEVRNQILNGFEKLTDEQKVHDINEEEQLMLEIIRSRNDTVKMAVAMSELTNFKNRHIEKLNEKINIMKPKEEAYDVFIDGKNNQKMNQVAKVLGMGRNKLFEFLRKEKVLMEDNTPYQRFINQGYFVVKEVSVNISGTIKNKPQTLVTAKGVSYISKLLKK